MKSWRRQKWIAWTLSASLAAGCTGFGPKQWLSKSSDGPTKTAKSPAKASAKPSQQVAKTAVPQPAQAATQPPYAHATDSADPTRLSTPTPTIGASLYLPGAKLHEQQGQWEKAIELYRKALQAEPNNAAATIGLARLYDRQSRWDEALALYRRSIETHPEQPLAHNDLALCLARKGDLAGAVTSFQHAIQLDPHSKLYRNNIATILVEMRRNDEALQHLVAAHPTPVAHFNLGYLLHQRGYSAEAVVALTRAVELDPTLVPAQKLLERIQGHASSHSFDPRAATIPQRLPAFD